jgi:HD-GYP domain-containing protein (c-di-GMP phosphodiesterase class II)
VKDRLVPVLAAAAFVSGLPPAVLHFLGSETVSFGGGLHFATVAVTAAVATAAAVALTVSGASRRDGRAVLVGGAFSVMAALLCLHGVTTPGLLIGQNGVVAFTGGATLPVGGALLALTAVPALSRPAAVRPLIAAFAALLAVVVGLGVAAIVDPALVPSVPEPASPLAIAALAFGLACFAALGWRALRTYLLTRRGSDLVVVVGIVWLGAALAASLLLGYWQLGWWLGHGFEVVGIFFVGAPVALDLVRAIPSRPLLGDFRATELVAAVARAGPPHDSRAEDRRGEELVAAEEAFLGSQVRAFTIALATKDVYTEQHTRRVALRAVRVGEELGLAAGRLRALAIGALLHDVGKLSLPDEILKKPGPLTESEFAIVREHPQRGRKLLKEIGGFDDSVLRLVLDHHERLDGSGYPRGLAGADIDLDARILGVCDVYDALISLRVYREPWSHGRALKLLRDGAGKQFDVRCIDALERVLAREQEPSLRIAV